MIAPADSAWDRALGEWYEGLVADPAELAAAFNPEVPPAYEPLLRSARYKGAYGGRGSAKSHFFAERLLKRCVDRPGTRAVCIREVQRSLEQSVKRLLEDKIQHYGLGKLFRVTKNHIETPGGGVIVFQGMQQHTAESIKSLEGFDVAWVEEAQSLSARSLEMLRPTIRLPDSELWFSWNPRLESDPVDQLLRGGDKPPGASVVRVNYEDNPWFPEVLRTEMEWDRRRDPEKYAHVWLGEYEKNSEARVFKNWKEEDFDTPEGAVFLLGGDWGYSVDPTVLVRGFIDGRRLYVDREAYRIGCEIDWTAGLFDGLECGCPPRADAGEKPPETCLNPRAHAAARKWAITADSARPETISYLQKHGYPKIVAAVKGADSVKEGVIFLQGYDIVVHPRCKHTIDELTMYSYKVDKKTGLVTPYLEDKKNHVIDSLRYAVERVRHMPRKGGWNW